MTDFNDMISNSGPSADSVTSLKRFPLALYGGVADQGDGAYKTIRNVSLSFNERRIEKLKFGSSVSSLKNLQEAQVFTLAKGNHVVSRNTSTKQTYSFDSSKSYYFRNISSSNQIISSDEENNKCGKRTQLVA